jgi:drug/metabolite transporter (DMT)-like permease
MSLLTVVGASVGATAFFALSTALKHRSARTTPDASGLEPRRLARFIHATARHPLYLGGLVADVVGVSLQVFALHIGALSVVQPLLTTALLFSLVLAHRVAGTRISRRELAWGAVLVVALIGFMVASGTVQTSRHAAVVQAADRVPAVLAGILAVALAATCVLTSRRLPSGGAAALMGVAVGTAYACTAALIKSCTNILAAGPVALLTSWQPYLLVVAGGIGLLLAQLAFQSGPLTASLPAIATVDPLLSVAIGVWVYDERLNRGPWAVGAEVGFLALMSLAAVMLSRVQAVAEDRSRRRTLHPSASSAT